MSGTLGYALGNGLVVALDQAPVILGSIVFAGHEVPSRITIGGAHSVTIHRLPGGGRIIDAMGMDDGAIGWSGYFTGPIAATRARLVDGMRQSGEMAALSFGDYAFNVVVVHFEYDLQDRGALISYRIRTEVVPDGIAQANDTSATISASLSNDIAAAMAPLPGFGLTAVQAALASIATAVALPGDATSASRLSAVGLALQGGANALKSSIAVCGGPLPAEAVGTSLGIATASALTATVAAAGCLAAATQAAGYINRSGSWLDQLAGQPQGIPLISA